MAKSFGSGTAFHSKPFKRLDHHPHDQALKSDFLCPKGSIAKNPFRLNANMVKHVGGGPPGQAIPQWLIN
jgi:hypothetical protein